MSSTIQSFSICLPKGCEAHCPYCISKQTGSKDTPAFKDHINVRIFHKACELARIGDVTTVLFTGKGEPMLYPELVDTYLREIQSYNFPIIEIQTNGIKLYRELLDHEKTLSNQFIERLETWQLLGLSTISISVAHYDEDRNKETFVPFDERYIDLSFIAHRLKEMGFLTRINCTMFDGGIDNENDVSIFIKRARAWRFDHIVLRPIYAVDGNTEVANWAKAHLLSKDQKSDIKGYFSRYPVIRELAHGAVVYSVGGQNVCLSNCMTREPENREELRQLIYLPEQIVTTEWEYPEAARLL